MSHQPWAGLPGSPAYIQQEIQQSKIIINYNIENINKQINNRKTRNNMIISTVNKQNRLEIYIIILNKQINLK